jgi:hypothetical protein
MTNNLLIEETLDELIKDMEIDNHVSQIYKALCLYTSKIEERLSVSKICIGTKVYVKARIVAKAS